MAISLRQFVWAIAILSVTANALTLDFALAKPPATVPQRLLTLSEIRIFKRAMQQQIKASLDLVGLGKANGQPPLYSNQLKTFQASWAKVDPAVAPFIGNWVWNWDTFPPNYRLSVFPSQTPGKVCLIEVDTGYDVDAMPVPKEFDLPPKFSTARITKAGGLGTRWRLHRSLIRLTQSQVGEPGNIEFLGAVTLQNQLRVYASAGVPVLNSTLPAPLLQQFQANHCLRSLPQQPLKPK